MVSLSGSVHVASTGTPSTLVTGATLSSKMGDVIVVGVSIPSASTSVTGVTDSSGNIYSKVIRVPGTGVSGEVWAALNARSASTNAVTVTLSSAIAGWAIVAGSYAGVGLVDAAGVGQAPAIAGTAVSVSATATFFGEVLIGHVFTPAAGQTSGLTTGYSDIPGTTTPYLVHQSYLLGGIAGSNSFAETLGTSQTFAAVLISLGPMQWGAIAEADKPVVTVSPNGIANGQANVFNDGADFGPDTVSTTTSGIQEAINSLTTSAAGTGLKTGGTVFLLPGLFVPTATIYLDENVLVTGGIAWAKVESYPVIQPPGGGWAGGTKGSGTNKTIVGNNWDSVHTKLAHGIGLHNVTIDGTNLNFTADGLQIINADHASLESVSVYNCLNGSLFDNNGFPKTNLPGQIQGHRLLVSAAPASDIGVTCIGIDIHQQTQVQLSDIQSLFDIGSSSSIQQASVRIYSSNKCQITRLQAAGATGPQSPPAPPPTGPALAAGSLVLQDDGSIGSFSNTIVQVWLNANTVYGVPDVAMSVTLGLSINNQISVGVINTPGSPNSLPVNSTTSTGHPLIVSMIQGYSDAGYNLGYIPAGVPAVATRYYNANPFSVVVYLTGAVGIRLYDKESGPVFQLLPAGTVTVVLGPSDSLYFVTTAPSAWLWKSVE